MTEDNKMETAQKRKKGRQEIVQAILWAVALIGSALILKGTEQADKVMWLLFVLAFSGTLSGGSPTCERRLWRKLTGKES
ncbi:hypothetical protein [Kordiimonas lacus]|uniref:Uncharacterized protein n=1 Tax=Kordiimonas lacus TaxID=637679 RepID=A0A1G6YAY8_9PROT|nr:hypothetical protein [Kordiimonas lacus]SDD87482.1 hypothetical protein SAMN04488071_1551 [Kordiimonas lacus]